MSDPITFPSSTPVIRLPLLIAGQAQKEFFVNQALCLLDALHPQAVTASLPAPPATVGDGECFRVLAPASGAWVGHEDEIAVLIGGGWHFVSPVEGMQLFDRAADHTLVFRSEWRYAAAPAAPTGGLVVDTAARAALAALIDALITLGILDSPNT